MTDKQLKPSLIQALIPIVFLIFLLSLNVYFFGDGTLDGSNQIALILSAGIAAIVALRVGFKWSTMLDGIVASISSAMSSILILLLIGSLAGTWLLSGIVPAMIYYGLNNIRDLFGHKVHLKEQKIDEVCMLGKQNIEYE